MTTEVWKSQGQEAGRESLPAGVLGGSGPKRRLQKAALDGSRDRGWAGVEALILLEVQGEGTERLEPEGDMISFAFLGSSVDSCGDSDGEEPRREAAADREARTGLGCMGTWRGKP